MRIKSQGFHLYGISKINEYFYGRFTNCAWFVKSPIIDLHNTIGTEPPQVFIGKYFSTK